MERLKLVVFPVRGRGAGEREPLVPKAGEDHVGVGVG